MSKRVSLAFLAVALAALLPSLLQIAWPFVTSFVLASILAVMVNPVRKRLEVRFRRPALASLITTLATFLVLGTLVALAGIALTHELTSAYESLSRRSLDAGGWPALATIAAERIVGALSTYLPLDTQAINTELVDRLKDAAGYLVERLGAAAGGVTTILITALLVTIFLYYILRHGEAWLAKLSRLVPLESDVTASLLRTVHNSVVANVNGMLAVAASQGLLLVLGFWFFGVRSPMLWGAVGGLASIIPVVGSPLVWLPVVIAFVFMGSYWKALFLGLWCAVIVGSVDNVLRPFVVSAGDKQHPVLIALAAIGGTYAFGVLGILLGPLVLSLAAALIKEIQSLVYPRPSGDANQTSAS